LLNPDPHPEPGVYDNYFKKFTVTKYLIFWIKMPEKIYLSSQASLKDLLHTTWEAYSPPEKKSLTVSIVSFFGVFLDPDPLTY
jgi:hypothetical protein